MRLGFVQADVLFEWKWCRVLGANAVIVDQVKNRHSLAGSAQALLA